MARASPPAGIVTRFCWHAPRRPIQMPAPLSMHVPLLLLGCAFAPAAGWRLAVQPQGMRRSGRAGHPVLQQQPGSPRVSAAPGSGAAIAVVPPSAPASGEWQLDFYSRPVQGADGKKLWELLVTDSAGEPRPKLRRQSDRPRTGLQPSVARSPTHSVPRFAPRVALGGTPAYRPSASRWHLSVRAHPPSEPVGRRLLLPRRGGPVQLRQLA